MEPNINDDVSKGNWCYVLSFSWSRCRVVSFI